MPVQGVLSSVEKLGSETSRGGGIGSPRTIEPCGKEENLEA
jgi:hypothetical protein